MFGWRARIGFIAPAVYLFSQEWDRPLPEGVVWATVSLGVRSLVSEDLNRAFNQYLWAGETLASREVDIIICGGSAVQLSVGYEKSQEIANRIQETTGIPTILDITALTSALDKLAAKKIVIATPYENERNEEHKKYLEKRGIDVLNMKGLGLRNTVDITKQPPYASYRLAREAFRETPQADAIWIGCPAWPVLSNVDILERDLGVPVITDVTYFLWAALTALNIKSPIKGYGKLLEIF
ncbi:hypothetical protein ACFLTW_00395 [Chloroflexota bacterium]